MKEIGLGVLIGLIANVLFHDLVPTLCWGCCMSIVTTTIFNVEWKRK